MSGKVDLDDFDDDDDDEYKPNGDEHGEAIGAGDKIELKREVGEGERLRDKQVAKMGLLKAAEDRMEVAGNVTAGGEAQGIKNEVLYNDSIAAVKDFKEGHELGDFFAEPRPGKGLKVQVWV